MDAQGEPETAVVDGSQNRQEGTAMDARQEPESAGDEGHGRPTGARVCRSGGPRTPDVSQSPYEWTSENIRREPEMTQVGDHESSHE